MKKIITLFVLWVGVFALTQPVYAIVEKTNTESIDNKIEKRLTENLEFEDILSKAQEHSYDLKIADFNTLIAKQEIRSARSEYFPKLGVSIGQEYTKNFKDLATSSVASIGDNFINPYTRFQSVMGVTLTYNIFDFGVRGGTLKASKEEVGAKEYEHQEKLQELCLNVLDTYSKLLLYQKQLDLYTKMLALEEDNLTLKKRLFEAKEISKIELDDEEIKVNKIKSQISELNSIMAESLNWLEFYTGETYNAKKLKFANIKKSDFDVNSFHDYTKTAIWKKNEKLIKQKEYQLYVAKRMNYPKINAYSRYYFYGSDPKNYGDNYKDIGPSNFTVGASANMMLFDGMKNRANIQKTNLELQQLNIQRDKEIATFATRLATMRSNLIYLDEQISINTNSLNSLKSKEKSNQRLVAKKIISPMDLNDTKIELLQQEIELEKNKITATSIKRGIQILTDYKD